MTSTQSQPLDNSHLKLDTLFSVKGKTVLISYEPTEGALVAARALAANGAKVYMIGRSKAETKRLIESLGSDIAGSIIPVIPYDLDSKSCFIDIFDTFSQHEPHLDILINAVGLMPVVPKTESKTEQEPSKDALENGDSPPVKRDPTFRSTGSRCTFLTTGFRGLLGRAPKRPYGWTSAIINIASTSAPQNAEEHRDQCKGCHELASNVTDRIAKFVASKGDKGDSIRVNGIAPGVCPFEFTASKDKHAGESLAARQGNERAMAAAVLFVASNQHLNEQVITVDDNYIGVAAEPRLFIAVNRPDNADSDIKDFELSLDMTVGDLKGLIQEDTGLEPGRQLLFFNDNPLHADSQTLQDAGIKDQDMLSVSPKDLEVPRSTQSERFPPAQIEAIRRDFQTRLRSQPQIRGPLDEQFPGLTAAIDDPARFRETFERLQSTRTAEIDALENDMSEEGQAKIYDAIRQKRVEEEAEKIQDEHPEVTMLYVSLTVNGHPVKAFVDSGAQATIMSPDCAEACGVMKSLDKRFQGVAVGVGTAKILGRVHNATIAFGDFELPCAFTVMEGKDVDLLFGLDMLKRYQASIDLLNNKLVLAGTVSVPFLSEAEIPKREQEALDKEPTIPGPGNTVIGAESGSIKPAGASSSRPSSSGAGRSAFGGQGRTLGPGPAAPPAQAPAPRPALASAPPSQYPESSIQILVGLGASREEAVQALQACNGNVEYAAGMFF